MLFTRIHTYYFPMRKEELKNRLVGNHLRIHNLDFEILEREKKLSIIPHAEQIDATMTLPITSVVFNEEGNQTKVTVTSRMRQLDSGGPMLIMTFCAFMFIISMLLYSQNRESNLAFTLMGISTSILTLFSIRLQLGYFDYIRKVREYVKNKANAVAESSFPLAHA